MVSAGGTLNSTCRAAIPDSDDPSPASRKPPTENSSLLDWPWAIAGSSCGKNSQPPAISAIAPPSPLASYRPFICRVDQKKKFGGST